MKKLTTLLVAVLALAGCGSTKTVTKKVTVTSVVTITNQITPQSCKDALAQADLLFNVARDFATTMLHYNDSVGRAFTAAAAGDVAAIEAVTTELTTYASEISDETGRLEAITPDYQSASRACSAS